MNHDRPRNAQELVQGALRGGRRPRPAVGPLAVHYCARLAGVSLRDYTLHPALLADCVVRYYERFRPDTVWLSADTWVTAQAMGAKVSFPGEDQPLAGTGEPLVRSPADIDRIPAPDPGSQGRWPLMLEALRRLHDALGQEVFLVACFDQYPFSLACALLGLENAMLKLTEDRPMLEALLHRGHEYAVAYGRALAATGCHLLSGGDSPAGLLGPRLYRQIALPFEQRVIADLRASTGLPISLHICGRATALLADMADSGAAVLEFDHLVDLGEACRILPRDIAIWGNLDPVGLLARGSKDDVVRAARTAVRTVAEAGHDRFVLSSGCTLAVETPPENVQALIQAAHDHPNPG